MSKSKKIADFAKGLSQGRAIGRQAVRGIGAATLGLAAYGAAHKAFGAARASKGSSTHFSRFHQMMKKHKK